MLRTEFWGVQRQYWSLHSGKQYYYIHSRTCKYLPYSVSLKDLAFLLLPLIYFQDGSLIRKNCTGQERLREFEVRPLLFAVGSDEAENQVQPTPSSPFQLSFTLIETVLNSKWWVVNAYGHINQTFMYTYIWSID